MKDIVKELENQFVSYKNDKTMIDRCSSFDDYSETKRLTKGLILDYNQTSEYEIGDYNYDLILVYLTNKNEKPISYYLFVNVEKKFTNHTSLLSLRFSKLSEAEKKYFKYQKLFDKKSTNLLLEEIKKDMLKNEWDLY